MQKENLKQKIELKQRAYWYALKVIKLLDSLNKSDFVILVIAKQLLRSATSIGANIIEAQAGSSRKDFTNFFSYALKSANESKFWLGLLRDSNKASTDAIIPVITETTELANILASSILTLKGKKI
jgi:four helix bundle protein